MCELLWFILCCLGVICIGAIIGILLIHHAAITTLGYLISLAFKICFLAMIGWIAVNLRNK